MSDLLKPEEIKVIFKRHYKSPPKRLTDTWVYRLAIDIAKAQLAKRDKDVCPECGGTGMGRFQHNRKALCDTCQGTGRTGRPDGEGQSTTCVGLENCCDLEVKLNEERERILSMIWIVKSGIGKGSGRVSKANLQALKEEK